MGCVCFRSFLCSSCADRVMYQFYSEAGKLIAVAAQEGVVRRELPKDDKSKL